MKEALNLDQFGPKIIWENIFVGEKACLIADII